MSQEERVETLPNIIKSLAQQLTTRDVQLKNQRTKFDEELVSAKHQQDVMRAERDNALRAAEDVGEERNRLIEQVKLQNQRELVHEGVVSAKLNADFKLEIAELTTKIGLLEQAAAHHAGELVQARREAEDWKSRYTIVSTELRRLTEEWRAQFGRVANSLEELSTVRRNSDSRSSPTVVPPCDSSPPNSSPAKMVSSLKDPGESRRATRPECDSPNKPSSNATAAVRSTYPQNALSKIITINSETIGNVSPQQKQRLHQAGDNPPPLISQQRQPGAQPQGEKTLSSQQPLSVISSSQSVLPPDRVIITAHYEIKKEEDDDDGDADLSSPHVQNRPQASGSGVRHSRDECSETEDGEPLMKRRRKATRKHSARRVIHDEDGEESQLLDEHRGVEGAYDGVKEDFDEMAIGAEENHKEVYGHRRVNVREVNTRPRTPSHRPHGHTVNHSDGSSSKKRKIVAEVIVASSRPATARKR